MKLDPVRKFVPPSGAIMSFTLIGVLLLSAFIYYRATNIQRFLEPALALSQPRSRFSHNINVLLLREFGKREMNGIKFISGSILVEPSLLFEGERTQEGAAPVILTKLSRVFLSALNDEDMRNHISLILVIARIPSGPNMAYNRQMRFRLQDRATLVLNTLYSAEPRLEKEYGTYFAATALSANDPENEAGWMEFRIIPTELLHIEVLEKLEKYAY